MELKPTSRATGSAVKTRQSEQKSDSPEKSGPTTPVTNANCPECNKCMNLRAENIPKLTSENTSENVELFQHESGTSLANSQNQENGYATAVESPEQTVVRSKLTGLPVKMSQMRENGELDRPRFVEFSDKPDQQKLSKHGYYEQNSIVQAGYQSNRYEKGDSNEIIHQNLPQVIGFENAENRQTSQLKRNSFAEALPYPPEMYYRNTIPGRQALFTHQNQDFDCQNWKTQDFSRTGSKQLSNDFCDDSNCDVYTSMTSRQVVTSDCGKTNPVNSVKEPTYQKFGNHNYPKQQFQINPCEKPGEVSQHVEYTLIPNSSAQSAFENQRVPFYGQKNQFLNEKSFHDVDATASWPSRNIHKIQNSVISQPSANMWAPNDGPRYMASSMVNVPWNSNQAGVVAH